MLKTERLTRTFGGLAAVSNLDLNLRQGELVGLIGPNGAGKTTIFNLLTGVYIPTSGDIVFENQSLWATNLSRLAKAWPGLFRISAFLILYRCWKRENSFTLAQQLFA